MGAIVFIYGFLCAFWGAAIVLFLLGWIKTGSQNQKDIWVGEFAFGPVGGRLADPSRDLQSGGERIVHGDRCRPYPMARDRYIQ